MLKNINNNLAINIFSNLLFVVTILMMIFTRSFAGLRLFGFRFGELVVGFGLLLIIIWFIYFIFIDKDYFNFFPHVNFLFLISSFIFTILLSRGSLFSQYTYKSSSYLWMIGYLFLGYFFFNVLNFSKLHLFALGLTPLIIYIFNSGNYPDFIMFFFERNGDKFQFIKGSDVLMAFIFCLFILKDKFDNIQSYLYYVNTVGFLMLPLFLTLSRASFFSSCLLLISINLSFRSLIKSNVKKYIVLFLVSIIIFILSAIRLAALPEINKNTSEPIIVIQDSVTEIVERKNTNQFLGFYFCEERLCSKDNTLDWRLDIWSDLTKDQLKKGKMIFGFGFNEIFEVMKDPNSPGRLGRDGLNENVHNHLFTLLGRMGIVGALIYFIFQYKLIINLKENIYVYLIPLFLVSAFDTTMESIQFPFLYYLLISYHKTKDL
tara:strand:+ start:4430 stop:5725 length:1296 start_codon:yes stop_codon:yes gene_type:complete